MFRKNNLESIKTAEDAKQGRAVRSVVFLDYPARILDTPLLSLRMYFMTNLFLKFF